MEKKFEIFEQNLTEGKACSLLFTHCLCNVQIWVSWL